ncbi:hypothetical protein DMC61_36130 [Amycolatopsis sp. WAC 04169]|uniref:hypothetical protein n=1 Tax=Amycolatopsis sp. WAC 04169 TaxID=2203197 RepID=UPI000F799733|nr:hypothetical protein [Amycolatopsis sp. WAC 04169]RSN21819.1 hypothetical protein DMC61_36130 [Amycolatopsis sp. WAC 04169]
MTTGMTVVPVTMRTIVPTRPSRRGRTVLSGLDSTDDFTHADQLTPEQRRLILFLIVVLSDDFGSLTGTYEQLVATYADQDGHWAYGKTITDLRSLISKWLGKSAVRIPSWERITDTLRVWVVPEKLPDFVAFAAGLYCDATLKDTPSAEYEGAIRRPLWAKQSSVTVATIRRFISAFSPDGISSPRTLLRNRDDEEPLVPVPKGTEAAYRQSDVLLQEVHVLKVLLDMKTRTCRRLEEQVEQLEEEIAAHQSDTAHQRRRAGEHERLREDFLDLMARNSALEELHMTMLRMLHPHASHEVLNRLVAEQIRESTPRHRGSSVKIRDHHRELGGSPARRRTSDLLYNDQTPATFPAASRRDRHHRGS